MITLTFLVNLLVILSVPLTMAGLVGALFAAAPFILPLSVLLNGIGPVLEPLLKSLTQIFGG